MFFGLGAAGIYIYIITRFDNLLIGQAKNFLIIFPIFFVFACIELWSEVKYGFKKMFILIPKLSKKVYTKIKTKVLTKRIEKGKKPSERDLKWLAKQKGVKNDN